MMEPRTPNADIIFGLGFRSHPTPAGIFRLADGRIVDVNESWLRLLGYERDEVIGKTQQELGIIDEHTREALGRLIRAKDSFSVADVVMLTKGHEQKHVVAAAQLQSMGGETYATAIVADHTVLVEAKEALRVALEELRRADAARLQLLSGVAHDLANPLTPIRINLAVIEKADPAVGEEFKKPLRAIARNVTQLVMMTKDLREFAKIQEKQFVIRKQPLDLSKVVAEVLEALDASFQSRGIRLQSHVHASLDVSADPVRIPQVLFNLLGNAAKFTPTGGTVDLGATIEDGQAVLRVRDSGPGMDALQVSRLFQPFSQVHEVTASEVGTGLGLFICRRIVEGHGGRIWAESPGPGKGSTFSFCLPQA
ncbi:MAG: PAS domain-containing sensor histidine kinase [Thermoplasmatota archaeon]